MSKDKLNIKAWNLKNTKKKNSKIDYLRTVGFKFKI